MSAHNIYKSLKGFHISGPSRYHTANSVVGLGEELGVGECVAVRVSPAAYLAGSLA